MKTARVSGYGVHVRARVGVVLGVHLALRAALLGRGEVSAGAPVSCIHLLPMGCPSSGVRRKASLGTAFRVPFPVLTLPSATPELWPSKADNDIAHLMRSLEKSPVAGCVSFLSSGCPPGHLRWPLSTGRRLRNPSLSLQAQGAPVSDGQDTTRLGVKGCAQHSGPVFT